LKSVLYRGDERQVFANPPAGLKSDLVSNDAELLHERHDAQKMYEMDGNSNVLQQHLARDDNDAVTESVDRSLLGHEAHESPPFQTPTIDQAKTGEDSRRESELTDLDSLAASDPISDYMFFLNRMLASGEITLAMLEAAIASEKDYFESWDEDKTGTLDTHEWAAMNAHTQLNNRLGPEYIVEPEATIAVDDVLSAAAIHRYRLVEANTSAAGAAGARGGVETIRSVETGGGGGGSGGGGETTFEDYVRMLLRHEARSVVTGFWGYIVDHRRGLAQPPTTPPPTPPTSTSTPAAA
jgi:hypothetical protein